MTVRFTPAEARGRRLAAAVLLLLVAPTGVVVPLASASLRQGDRTVSAHAARTVNGNDNASLHLVHASGSTLYEEGQASGSLPGRVRGTLRVEATFTGRFTIYTRSGQIVGVDRPDLARAVTHTKRSPGRRPSPAALAATPTRTVASDFTAP